MAKIGYTMTALRTMVPGWRSVDTDMRLVWEKDDPWHLGVAKIYDTGTPVMPLPAFCGTREMRLLAAQLLAHADELDRETDPHEEIAP